MLKLATLTPDVAGFSHLLAESLAEQQRMLARFAENWSSGSNWFDKPGEVILGVWSKDRLIGTCGRNIDPYDTHPRAGRVRQLYVVRDARQIGAGTMLIAAIVNGAGEHFDYLNTNAPETASAFYERLGFTRLDQSPHATHRIACI